MTPSEELAAMDDSQENEKNKDPSKAVDQICSSASSSTNAFRVKQVSEINKNADNTVCERSALEDSQNYGKRKLPSWMLSSNDVSQSEENNENSKRLKTLNPTDDCTSDANAEAAELPRNEKKLTDSADGPSSSSSNKVVDIKTLLVPASDENEDPQPSTSPQNEESNESSKRLKTLESNPTDDCTSANAEAAELPRNEEKTTNSADGPSSSSSNKVVDIKKEPVPASDENEDPQPSTSSQNGISNPVDVKPASSVKKEEATSTSRESCRFGIRCYRQNPMHRIEEAHPGDHDYRRPNFPAPPKGTPDCPYGDRCYRRNPTHFQQFYHPPETDFEQNWKNYRMRLRQRRQVQYNLTTNTESDLDDYDLDDPFIDDGDDEYIPSDDAEDADYDDCDKAEE